MTSEKVIEVVASSRTSLEDAMLQGVEQAKQAIARIGESEAAGPLSDEADAPAVRYTVTMHIDFEIEAADDDDEGLIEREAMAGDRPREGEIAPGDEVPAGTAGAGEAICPRCSGSGVLQNQPCTTCGGTGVVIEAIGGA